MAGQSISIDGVAIGQMISFTIENNVRTPPPPQQPLATGEFTVSGTLTCYFENSALLEDVRAGEFAMQEWAAAIVAQRHKAQAWRSLRPKLYRAVAYGALAVALSTTFVSGVF